MKNIHPVYHIKVQCTILFCYFLLMLLPNIILLWYNMSFVCVCLCFLKIDMLIMVSDYFSVGNLKGVQPQFQGRWFKIPKRTKL